MKKGRHAKSKITFFGKKKGKHCKDELIVYNPVYARISACVSSLAIATSFFTCLSFGKYKGTFASSDVARVAKYVLKLESEQNKIERICARNFKKYIFSSFKL